MNTKQKLHQTNLAKWTTLFKEQASSGLTVKEWCDRNSISIHKYNYWKRLVKELYVDSVLPDIVPIAPGPFPSLSPDPLGSQQTELCNSLDSYNSPDLIDSGCISIIIGDIRIEIGSSASDEMVSGIIKAVRHV